MITIYTDSHFLPEKKYVFQVIFSEILNVDFCVCESSGIGVYKFVLPNGFSVECEDAFFSQILEPLDYCRKEFLPQKVISISYNETEVMPCLYGRQSYVELPNSIVCGGDIIASAFFMLSRWEETICSHTDKYDRFPENEAFAVKNNLIRKPLVHIYAEFLRSVFNKHGMQISQNHTFTKTFTHDIDFLFKWNSKYDFVKTCCADILRRFSIQSLKKSITLRNSHQDPYDVYDYLMQLSEDNHTKSTFYLLNLPKNTIAFNSEQGKQVIQKIQNRGHLIGLHSNYYREIDAEKVKADKVFFESLYNCQLTKNRQHYLKMNIPETLGMLQKLGIEQDSSLYYTHAPGFRTGMCIEHSLFDYKSRTIMKIKELPLILMDVSLLDAPSKEEAISWIDELFEQVQKYQGNFVCLWHNSSFHSQEWDSLSNIYEYIVTK